MRLQAVARPFPISLSRGKEAGITIPELVSAEIGNVNGYTVVTVWDSPVTDVPVVIITVNDAAQTIVSSGIQMDDTVVHYVIPIPWRGLDDVVKVNGNVATNNMGWFSGLNLQATALSLGVLSTFVDQSIYNHDFTQTGDARPDVQDIDGYRFVVPDGVDDWMNGSNFADNLDKFAVMVAILYTHTGTSPIITKLGVIFDNSYNGWQVQNGDFQLLNNPGNTPEGYSNVYQTKQSSPIQDAVNVMTFEKLSNTELHEYLNGVLNDFYDPADTTGTLTTFTTPETVKLFVDGGTDGPDNDGYGTNPIGAVMLLQISDAAKWALDRLALETRVGALYGATI